MESGWIDKATKFLGVGRWAIGRPKSVPHAEPLKVKPARHIETVPQKQSSPQSQIVDIAPIRIETIFNQLLPNQFRIAQGLDDKRYRLSKRYGYGLSWVRQDHTCPSLSAPLGRKYGNANTVFALQVGGVRELLGYATRQPGKAWFLVGEDLTLARIPKSDLNQFFQVRHLIQQNTGINQGLAITGFMSHTFHGIDKNLRDTFDMLVLKSVPTNPYDRSILKRYFDPWLLDEYSRNWAIDKCLVWSTFYPHGTRATINRPPANAIENETVKRSIWSRLFGR